MAVVMAASSSRMRPRSTACHPFCATSASRVARLESRIWPGASGPAGLDELVAGGQDADPRPGVDEHLGHTDPGQHAEVPGADHLAGGEHRIADAEVVASLANRLAGGHLRPQGDPRAVVEPGRALDHEHGVGPGRHRRPGEDAHRLAGLESAVGRMPGRHLGDHGEHDGPGPVAPAVSAARTA